MPKGRNVPPRPERKPAPTIMTLDIAMLEGEAWKRETWVAENWHRLAALSWRGYLAAGRGMVRLTVNPDVQACDYIPLSLAADYGLRHHARAFMREYDPKTEIIVGFHDLTPTPGNPGGELRIFQFQAGGMLETPPAAWSLEQRN